MAGSVPPPAPAAPSAAPASPRDNADLATRRKDAAAAFERGLAHKDRGELELALGEFERAYEILPAYPVLYYVGAVNAMLARWAAARRAFELYLQLGEGSLGPEEVARAHAHLEELQKRTATLSLILNVPGAEVQIDGAKQEPTAVTGLILDPGQHVVRVSKPGFYPLEQHVEAANGQTLQLILPLTPEESGATAPAGPGPGAGLPRAPSPVTASEAAEPPRLWVPWAITGVLTAAWVTTAALAIQARHDRDIIERPGTPAERIDDARQLHVTLAVVSDVLLVSALASAGVSAYLTWWSSPAASAAQGKAGSPYPSGLVIGARGQF